MPQIISADQTASQPFVIPKGGQVTLFAAGLQGADKVTLHVVTTTRSGPTGDLCCPGPVALPELVDAVPLRLRCNCGDFEAVELTAEQPWVVLNGPQALQLQARVVVADPLVATVTVDLFETVNG
jgi:hypothetical protein